MYRAVFALLAALTASTSAQELRVPVLGEAPLAPTNEAPAARALIELAEETLSAGLSSTSAELHRRALTISGISDADRERATLGIAFALLERNQSEQAIALVKPLPNSPRKALRLALAGLLQNDTAVITEAVSQLNVEALPPEERPWALAITGMVGIARETPDSEAVIRKAVESAVSEAQRQRIELLAYRSAVQKGQVDDASLASMERRARETKGTEAGFVFARTWATLLARRGKIAEAAAVLQDVRGTQPARQAEADLAAGIILGPTSEEGISRLRLAAGNAEAPALIRSKAIRALATSVNEAAAERTVQLANATYAFLSDSRNGCPRSPEITDAIHLARAQIMLTAGNRELARNAADDLLRETPGSPLVAESVRILAFLAWGDGSYRLASSHLDRLVTLVPTSRRDAIRATSADCLFLAHDYAVAARAYTNLQKDATETTIRDSAFHQAILCMLEEEGGLDNAAKQLEDGIAKGTITRVRILMGAWNIADYARRRAKPEDFARMLGRFSGVSQSAPIDFALRFEWLRALSALANGDRTSAMRYAESVINTLQNLPKDASPQLLAAAPELRAHAALLKARASAEAKSGVEIRELVQLRERYGKVSAGAASYLAEGRLLASEGRHAEAQKRFEELAKDYANDPALAEFAALGLHEAAEQAAILAATEGESKLREAVGLLSTFITRYPGHPLVFQVTIREAEILRNLGDFDSALRLMDELTRQFPQHPQRAQAELARADCLMGLAALRRAPNGGPDRARISRAVAAYERVVETWSRDSDAVAESRHKLAQALLDRASGESVADANATRRDVRQLLAREATDLLSGSRDTLGMNGRSWVSRSLLLLGERCEADGDRKEAIAAYRLLRDLNAGLVDSESRLPGKALAESKLAELERAPSNPTK